MNDKQRVAIEAAKRIQDGMVVGLGTGSTANYFIQALAQRHQQGLSLHTVASSTISAIQAQQHGLPLLSLPHIRHIDVYVDGADEITPALTLLKGRGQDLVMEKILARAATQFIVVADPSKWVQRIGEKFVIPIEVLPDAWQLVHAQLTAAGATGALRLNANQDNVALSARGNYLLDMRFAEDISAQAIDEQLNALPGVVEHGIFDGLTDVVLVADQGEIQEYRAKQ